MKANVTRILIAIALILLLTAPASASNWKPRVVKIGEKYEATINNGENVIVIGQYGSRKEAQGEANNKAKAKNKALRKAKRVGAAGVTARDSENRAGEAGCNQPGVQC